MDKERFLLLRYTMSFLSMRGCHFNRVRDDLLKPNKKYTGNILHAKKKRKKVSLTSKSTLSHQNITYKPQNDV